MTVPHFHYKSLLDNLFNLKFEWQSIMAYLKFEWQSITPYLGILSNGIEIDKGIQECP